jgi:hypothetical protein
MSNFLGQKGEKYSRTDIQEILNVPPDRRGGDWSTGYTRYNNEFFLFVNVGNAGRTGHDYENQWEENHLVWFSKGGTSINNPQIQDLISGRYPVHVFSRSADRTPFIYAGKAKLLAVKDQSPVQVRWSFEKEHTSTKPRVDIAATLSEYGFHLDPPLVHTQRAVKGSLVVYIKQQSASFPLVIPPEWSERLADLIAVGGERPVNRLFYHNATMRSFPSRSHGGREPIKYGIDFGFANRRALSSFLQILTEDALPPVAGPTQQTVDPRTETEVTRACRLGQQKFREELISEYEQCPVTGIDMPELLRASHIKPWSLATNAERLDCNNGILLAIHVDVLFDKGLMTFKDDGEIVFSSRLSGPTLGTIRAGMFKRLTKLTPKRLSYLEYHREQVFRP